MGCNVPFDRAVRQARVGFYLGFLDHSRNCTTKVLGGQVACLLLVISGSQTAQRNAPPADTCQHVLARSTPVPHLFRKCCPTARRARTSGLAPRRPPSPGPREPQPPRRFARLSFLLVLLCADPGPAPGVWPCRRHRSAEHRLYLRQSFTGAIVNNC